ncbi:MAG: portal protein [Rhodospirillales bacterium]
MSQAIQPLTPPGSDQKPDPQAILERFRRAKERRSTWEDHWRECYDYALPRHDGALDARTPGEKKTDNLFDATAPDAVEQLAASLLALLTPPWARWFGLSLGAGAAEEDEDAFGPFLDEIAETLQVHFDRSNFAVEMHQCYLDLVTVGTASLMFEEASFGEPSAFRFTAVPLSAAILEEGPLGKLDQTFRRALLTRAQLLERYPGTELPDEPDVKSGAPERRYAVVEAVRPESDGYRYTAVLDNAPAADLTEGSIMGSDGIFTGGGGSATLLREGRFRRSPFINFRWLKAPGEAYGRSPVMKALPDIKTVNKAVELTLKNATIAVTGIWQADDDGVLNPATVKLVPGTIIPKAVGSQGLRPLDSPGRFDISQMILEDLRGNIRRALLVDKLGEVNGPRMTATEILERSAEMARLLGATFGRLQSELLTPLVLRAVDILIRRGEIPPIVVDGRSVDIQYRSPLAQDQSRKEAKDLLNWVQALAALGPEALALVDAPKAARWLAKAHGVPNELLVTPDQAGTGGLAAQAGPALAALQEGGGLAQLLSQLPPEAVQQGQALLSQMTGGKTSPAPQPTGQSIPSIPNPGQEVTS